LGGYLLGTGALSGGRQTSTAAILSTATPSPVSAPTTAQSSVPPRASPLATAEPSETAISATSTPAPSETQQNTPTTAATATASLVLPFQDNFDQGLRPEWRVVEGQPLMTGGRLQGADYTLTLQLGDAALEDYTVRFDTPNSCGSNNAGFILTVAERVQFEMRASYFVWRAFNGTDWTVLPSNNYLSCPHNVRITMASGKYTVAISNAIVLDAQYGTAIAGPLTISLKDHQPIDNFSLTNP
jgi:hypothetical protein